MRGARPIVLLTDFGDDDFYAGILRAVISAASPASPIIDLSHGIAAHNVRAASFVLASALPYLPADAVVVAVIDPGVGGARRGIIVETGGRAIVAPDNGLASDLIATAGGLEFTAIADDRIPALTSAGTRGATFHGRDVFAPVAAALARGVSSRQFGDETGGVVMLRDVPSVSVADGCVTGAGRMVDRFGNILTDIPRRVVERAFAWHACRVTVGGVDAGPPRGTYSDGTHGELMAIFNSWDRVEAAVREGRAIDRFGGAAPEEIRFEIHAA
ncbi:MAG TPA: SAM-dependent chlorinase/fluorinase [Candidatus Krumholzibacteria bacterium]|nr:SAM-dependent chlorinase/fluorinase [Candidatus Krumholzibacteria bacterium]